MADNDAVFQYHERSKHHLHGYAPGPRGLDWATQPDPFRTYASAPRVAFALAADALPARFSDLRAGRLPAPVPVTAESIGVMLELSLAISAWKSYRGSTWALRCNPSSGNLHPTEGYIVTAEVPGLRGGVYHYAPREHALELRAPLATIAAPIGKGFIVGLASIYWREAWKYGMRAYRYCQHDCGHAIAAVSYAAASLGWQTRLLDAPADAEVSALLGLDRASEGDIAEHEQPDCLLWVGAGEPAGVDALVAAASAATWTGSPNRLSREHVHWREIDLAHQAARKPRTRPETALSEPATFEPVLPRLDLAAATLYRQRRSAVDFDGATSIPADVCDAAHANATASIFNRCALRAITASSVTRPLAPASPARRASAEPADSEVAYGACQKTRKPSTRSRSVGATTSTARIFRPCALRKQDR